MTTILDHIFDNIHLYKDLEELRHHCEAELNRRHIHAVAEYNLENGIEPLSSADNDEDYIDADEWVASTAFLRTLLTDPRCPEWLHKQIVWEVLKQDIN